MFRRAGDGAAEAGSAARLGLRRDGGTAAGAAAVVGERAGRLAAVVAGAVLAAVEVGGAAEAGVDTARAALRQVDSRVAMGDVKPIVTGGNVGNTICAVPPGVPTTSCETQNPTAAKTPRATQRIASRDRVTGRINGT